MNNNYEYVEKLKEDKEEQKKIEEQLQKELDILLISEEEKEKLLSSVIKTAIDSYTPTTLFPFLRYVKIKLKKEIEKKYFTPSQIISIEEQKIINLYLSKKEEQFLTEEEIRKRLQINSGTLYQAIFKLENGTAKTRKELLTLFPNYKEQIKERKRFFKQPVKTSEDSLRYLGYYIGEVDDICLDIHEIALKEGKKEEEIEKELKTVFKSLKEKTALQLVLKKYPNSEKMLQIKAKNFGIKLQTKEKDKTSKAKQTLPEEPRKTEKQEKTVPEKERKRKYSQKTSHEKSLLTEKQETLLKELAKNPNMNKKTLTEITGYKNIQSMLTILASLRKKCKTNEKLKEKILELYPDFLTPKPKVEKKKKEKKEKPLLTEKQETLLKELAKNPNIDKKTLTEIAGYKNIQSIWATLFNLRKKCKTNEKLKEKILELYPEFLTPKPRPKQKTKKKEQTLLTKRQEILLQELAKNPNTSKKELAKILGYKNTRGLYSALERLKKKIKQNEKLQEKVLELYPGFIKSKGKTLLTEKEEKLLQELAKNPNISKKELAKILGYKNTKGLYSTLGRLKKECEENENIKEKVLELYPEFINPKEKPLLTKRQEILLQELAKNPTITIDELVKITGYKNQASLQNTLGELRKNCIQKEELKIRVLEIYPELLTKKKEKKKKEKKEKPLLTKKEEKLLQELAKNPNISRKVLAEVLEYKGANSLYAAINKLKKKCEQNEKTKEMVLELYPEFINPKEKPILTKKQEILLQGLAKDPTITIDELVEITGYKNQATLRATLNKLRKDCTKKKELKEKALELYPEFLTPKQKLEKKKKEKKENLLLPKKQEILLQELAKNPTITIDELVEITGYKNQASLQTTLNKLKRNCEQNEKLKARVLELYPEFLKPKPKKDQVLTNRELEILQSIYLIVPPNTSYATYKQLAKKLHFSEQNILAIKKQALKKIEASSEIQKQLEESWPTFDQDKVIKEQYKKVRSIKIPSEEVEGIKTFIRQFDIPENEITEQENPILTGIKNLEESIFSSYVSKCTEEQKAMLALRLGYINVPARTETVAKLFNVEEQEVITLTKNCLKSVKIPTDTKRTAKVYEKKN